MSYVDQAGLEPSALPVLGLKECATILSLQLMCLWCESLNEKDSYRLIDLNTYSPGSGTI